MITSRLARAGALAPKARLVSSFGSISLACDLRIGQDEGSQKRSTY
ncbi:hypothetical protein N7526_007470 [Penicillium atrosanguineum]|nr:hypothetical protein N7526_007470 [Penicillium atrosanguineum]